jgi:hypothetical protein
MVMLSPFSDPANEVSAPPGDFESNYRHLKSIINRALKQGTPIEDLHLIPKKISPGKQSKHLSQDDLLKLLHVIRRIKVRYEKLLQSPVPRELERDILAKSPEDRLPWEEEALEKQAQWRRDVKAVRARVQKELNDHLNAEFFG